MSTIPVRWKRRVKYKIEERKQDRLLVSRKLHNL